MWDLKDKVVVITGATNGIGRAAALAIAKHNPKLFLTYRDYKRGQNLLIQLKKIDSNLQIELIKCDFLNQASIRECAATINKKTGHINVLINNAGIFNVKYRETLEGIENTFAVNHLGYFLFTNLLLNKLGLSEKSRIINVTSETHELLDKLNWEDINFSKDYGEGVNAYAQSKLSNLMFTYLLASKLSKNNISVNAIHPGVINTGIGTQDRSWIGNLLKALLAPFLPRPEDGATSIIYLATKSDAGTTGEYFIDCKQARSSPYSKNLEEAQKLWDLSEHLVNEEFSI
jgi:NAD(P)-dependent dehydrogenase (short-subunit alcohol dehydrogenase family)